jgi:hypothetical protein
MFTFGFGYCCTFVGYVRSRVEMVYVIVYVVISFRF